jgi:tetratricopeptide (TPR) repeat protein
MSEAPEFREALQAFNAGDLDRARSMAEQSVKSQPSPGWHHLLGLILCRLGEPVEGASHLETAAKAEPSNAAFQVMLARALVDAGRAQEVLAMPEPPPVNSAASLALWQARAEAADALEDHRASAVAWAHVANASPNDWRALSNLGNALAALGQWVEASEALSEAVKLNPAEAALRANAVTALAEAGRKHQSLLQFDDANQAFRRAHDIDPANPSIVQLLGVAFERTNRLDELDALIEQAATAGVANDRLNYSRALLARRRGDIEAAHELLLASDPQDDPVRWNALRAKIADSLGRTAEAFDAAVAMNAGAMDRAAG